MAIGRRPTSYPYDRDKILSVLGWTTLARVVRGKILSLREEDFVMAARLDGESEWTIITKYLLPGFTSYIIVSLTIAVSNMIHDA